MKSTILLGIFIANCCLSAVSQTKLFHGTWTRLGTEYLFEFDLHLEHGQGNTVSGYFNWKIVRYDENDPFGADYYRDKLGMTAKEYVSGRWDAATRTYHLKGYAKDDPNTIIALDEYLLPVDNNGDIGGKTKSHDSWLGRINATSVVLLNL